MGLICLAYKRPQCFSRVPFEIGAETGLLFNAFTPWKLPLSYVWFYLLEKRESQQVSLHDIVMEKAAKHESNKINVASLTSVCTESHLIEL